MNCNRIFRTERVIAPHVSVYFFWRKYSFGVFHKEFEKHKLSRGFLIVGSILGTRPLLLAAFAGRIIGLLLLADGLADLINAHRRGIRGLMPLIIAILGGILLLMPMTASRLVFRLCGLVVLVIGGAMLFDRIRHPRLSRGKDDPNIIDAL